MLMPLVFLNDVDQSDSSICNLDWANYLPITSAMMCWIVSDRASFYNNVCPSCTHREHMDRWSNLYLKVDANSRILIIWVHTGYRIEPLYAWLQASDPSLWQLREARGFDINQGARFEYAFNVLHHRSCLPACDITCSSHTKFTRLLVRHLAKNHKLKIVSHQGPSF